MSPNLKTATTENSFGESINNPKSFCSCNLFDVELKKLLKLAEIVLIRDTSIEKSFDELASYIRRLKYENQDLTQNIKDLIVKEGDSSKLSQIELRLQQERRDFEEKEETLRENTKNLQKDKEEMQLIIQEVEDKYKGICDKYDQIS